MTPERYLNTLGEFSMLLRCGESVLQSVAGLSAVNPQTDYGEALFKKIIAHALSLKRLSPLLIPGQSELWDVSSCAALSRCLIEAHDALAYIALNPISDGERDFRVLLWKLHDVQRRLLMLEQMGSTSPDVTSIRQQVHALSAAVKSHSVFSKLTPDVVGKISRGDAPPYRHSKRAMNAESTVDHDYHNTATMHLSQFVHAHPFSLHQLRAFRAGEPDALRISSLPVQYAMPFLANAINGFRGLFPQCSFEFEATTEELIDAWRVFIKRGLTGE